MDSFNKDNLTWDRVCTTSLEKLETYEYLLNGKKVVIYEETIDDKTYYYLKCIKNKKCKNLAYHHASLRCEEHKLAKYCSNKTCNVRPNFGYRTDIRPTFCTKHKKMDMVNIRSKTCQKEGCRKQPYFNYINKKQGILCNDHKEPNMVNVKDKTCQQEGCTTRASYNFEGKKQGVFCTKHKKVDMVNVRGRRCQQDGCIACPIYNFKNVSKPIFCTKHKKMDMVDVRSRRCQKDGCMKYPSFNFETKTKPIFCKKHKLKNMIDVRSRRCQAEGCLKRPTYGFASSKRYIFCNDHKEQNMVNLRNKMCQKEGCLKCPFFNYKGEIRGIFCNKHKLKDMVDVKSKRCQKEDCDKRPSFNYIKEKRGIFCSDHKKINMVNVKNKRCFKEGCDKLSCCGKLFEKKNHCVEHKSKNEFLKNNPKCEFQDCKERPYYTNDKNQMFYPLRCENHKLDDDVNIVERKCLGCDLLYFIPSDKDLCQDCFDYGNNKIHHKKEHDVKLLLESNNIEIESYDSVISDRQTRCSLRRPDFIINNGTFKIIIEIDEFQHKSYLKECEVTRMKQIYFDFGGMDVVFIRYNPDKYKCNEDKIRNPRKTTRYNKLLKLINEYKNLESLSKHLEVCYLFYDGYNGNPVFENIDPYEDIIKEN